jgi:hypothetical protein
MTLDNGTWQGKSRIITILRELVERGTARITQTQHTRGFVEAFTRGVIS